MNSMLVRVTFPAIAILAWHPRVGFTQARPASWLDEPKPASWNMLGLPIPTAPQIQGAVDPRCRTTARPAELDDDKRIRDKRWDLVDAYQGGWQIVVIRGTASYDGMCRPRQYQGFVFVSGVFAGTLSPQAMDSRSDGALSRVTLQNNNRLTAEYLRYAATDALCCPSKTSRVEFEIATGGVPLLRPVSAFTSPNR